VLQPQPLGVLREALVEPDVLPQVDAEQVPAPLVRQFVHDDELTADRVGEESRCVDRPGLGLQRELELRVVVDDPAGGPERVRSEDLRQEVDDLRLARQRSLGHLPRAGSLGLRVEVEGEQVRIECVPVPDLVGAVLAHVELADRQGDQVGGHGLFRMPRPGRPAFLGALMPEHAVGDRFQAGGHRGGDGHRRGVTRVIVGGEPRGGPVGLAGHDRAVVGVHEARNAQCVLNRLGNALIGHDGRELPALPEHVLRRDRQLLTLTTPSGLVPVHRD
jgi:hypothetical protein